LTPFAYRLWNLYEWLQKGIKPWEWDHDNYTGTPEKESMFGRFYDEDIENIRQIDMWVNERLGEEQKRQEQQQKRASRATAKRI
jgi:hypothetical protein